MSVNMNVLLSADCVCICIIGELLTGGNPGYAEHVGGSLSP